MMNLSKKQVSSQTFHSERYICMLSELVLTLSEKEHILL